MRPHEQAAIDLALSLPCWKRPQEARLLGGGKTNLNVLLSDQGRRFVVRLGKDIPEHGVMRWNELAVSCAAYAAGAPPRRCISQGRACWCWIMSRPLRWTRQGCAIQRISCGSLIWWQGFTAMPWRICAARCWRFGCFISCATMPQP